MNSTLQVNGNHATTDVPQRILPTDNLTTVIAQLIDLRQQVKHSHWNVTGPGFIGLHHLFDDCAAELDKAIDSAAERQRALGCLVRGSLRDADEISTLKDFPAELTHSTAVLQHLIENYRQVTAELIEGSEIMTEAKDYGTSDIYADCLRLLDQHVYLMNSHFDLV